MNEYLPGIIWLFVLLIVNGFFVGAEFAVISARRSQIEPRAEAGSKAAKTTLWAMEHATLMLATSQLGITVCSLVILNVSEPAIHHLLEIPLAATPLTPEAIGVVAFVIALVLVTFLHVVVGEMIPKNLSFSVPDRAALLLAPPLVFVATVFKPVIWALNGVANGVLRLFRVEPKDEATSTYTLDEVATIVQQSTREGVLSDASGTLSAAFEFTTRKVRDVEVPVRADGRRRPADRLPAPQGRHGPDVGGGAGPARAGEARASARSRAARRRPRGRAGVDASQRGARRPCRLGDGGDHRRALLGGHHRGARRRGRRRDDRLAARTV
jgi:hypothetical protein